VILAAPAKVNLYLAVGARTDDGYHELVTVFQALDDRLSDTGGVRRSDRFSVEMPPDAGVPAVDKLALRAAEMLADAIGAPFPLEISIDKRIPAGGGLGGASTDAAAVLVGASTLWGVDPDSEVVVRCAQALGADVPFFLGGGTGLYGGRGDVRIRDLPTPRMDLVVVTAGEPVPTGAAYALHDRLLLPSAPGPDPLVHALEASDVRGVAALLHNDLAEAAKTLVPSVGDAESWLTARRGVLGAAITGSGSCVFGVCEKAQDAKRVEREARALGWWARACGVSPCGVRVVSDA
jgi:4-diphosphocytidyl-2-C-methyl-D-erythritol kinase